MLERPVQTGHERRPFVGRSAELAQLQTAFERAVTGQGSTVMLLGVPGIGKTALSEQLASFVASLGGHALIGHCHSRDSFAVPYQPFVGALGSYLRVQDDARLKSIVGTHAPELGRIIPSILDRMPVGVSAAVDASEHRFRLMLAVSDLLRRAAQAHPLLLVLEDLQDADRGTLDLLLHVAHEIESARVLLVGTYRDVELDRDHPLSATVAELQRRINFQRLRLSGLSVDDTQRLLSATTHHVVRRSLAELFRQRTDGNPLFTLEVLRYMIDEGLVDQGDGGLRGIDQRHFATHVPKGLAGTIGKRLAMLDQNTNQLLHVAAVLGREFRLDTLQRVQALTDDQLYAALEQAVNAGLVDEHSVVGATITYRFAHALFQQSLYEDILAPRRIRLHQQVARVLENVYSESLDEHAAELAEHFAFSSEPGDLIKALHYAQLAGQQAAQVFAYGEATRQIERALRIHELVNREDHAVRCELLVALGESLAASGDTESVITYAAPQALMLAEQIADRPRSFRACKLAIEALDVRGAAASTFTPEYHSWADRAAHHAKRGTSEQVFADLAVASAREARGDSSEAYASRVHALALARRCGDLDGQFRSAMFLLYSSAPTTWEERVQLAREAVAWPRDGVSSRAVGMVLWHAGRTELAEGNRGRATDLWKELEALGDRTQSPSLVLYTAQRDAILAILDGRLDESLTLLQAFVARADDLGGSIRGRLFNLFMLLDVSIYLGRERDWASAFQDYAERTPLSDGDRTHPLAIAWGALALAYTGRWDEAQLLAGPLLEEETRRGQTPDDRHITVLVPLLQCALVLQHRQAAGMLATRLNCIRHLALGDWTYASMARLLGAAAALNKDYAAARTYYTQALQSAAKLAYRPEAASTRVSLAEILLEEGDTPGALQQIELALPELRSMRMGPALARAVHLTQLINRQGVPTGPDDPAFQTLTYREREVVSLMARGQSNREIAAELVISVTTVEVHVKRVLAKLGLRSRSQVASRVFGRSERSS